jgi:hypothetical protein
MSVSAKSGLAVIQSLEKGIWEMKNSKRLLLAGAVAAVMALAVPTMALGAVWKDKGVNVNNFVEMGMSGGELFETTTGNGMSCEVSATLTTEGGSTGKITKWEIKKCPTGFGSFKECKLSTAEAKGLPWTVHVNASDLTVTNMRTKRTFTGCGISELDKTIGSVTVTLDKTTEISEMNFFGSISGYTSANTLVLNEAIKKTYGIG